MRRAFRKGLLPVLSGPYRFQGGSQRALISRVNYRQEEPGRNRPAMKQ